MTYDEQKSPAESERVMFCSLCVEVRLEEQPD